MLLCLHAYTEIRGPRHFHSPPARDAMKRQVTWSTSPLPWWTYGKKWQKSEMVNTISSRACLPGWINHNVSILGEFLRGVSFYSSRPYKFAPSNHGVCRRWWERFDLVVSLLSSSRPRTSYFTLCLVIQNNPILQLFYVSCKPSHHLESCLLMIFNLDSLICYIW